MRQLVHLFNRRGAIDAARPAATGRQGRVTAEYAEYAERKQASGRISAYFAYSAVQPSSGKSSQLARIFRHGRSAPVSGAACQNNWQILE